MTTIKTCSACGLEKVAEDFNKRKSSVDGRRTQCRACENSYARSWRKNNPEKHAKLNKDSYHRLAASSDWLDNKAEYCRSWRSANPDKAKKIERRYRNSIRGTMEYKIRTICGNLIKRSVSGSDSTRLPYKAKELMDRIEMNFLDGMTWDNYGEWHIDHKKPVSRFIKQGITDVAVINALSNLQPLWAKDNIAKGAKCIFK